MKTRDNIILNDGWWRWDIVRAYFSAIYLNPGNIVELWEKKYEMPLPVEGFAYRERESITLTSWPFPERKRLTL